jgi:hypothetical protein
MVPIVPTFGPEAPDDEPGGPLHDVGGEPSPAEAKRTDN